MRNAHVRCRRAGIDKVLMCSKLLRELSYQVPYTPKVDVLELAYCSFIESAATRHSKTAPDEGQPALEAKS